MPPKKNKQNKAAKQKEKRKEISPLFENTCSTQHEDSHIGQSKTSQAGQLLSDNKDSKHQRRQDAEFFLFDQQTISDMSSANINSPNFSQQFPSSFPGQFSGQFPGQYVQSPPTQFQFTQQTQQTPQWALDIMKDVRAVIKKVDKIDDIEKSVNAIHNKLADLEIKLKDIDT